MMPTFIKNWISQTTWFKTQVAQAKNQGYWDGREESTRIRKIEDDLRKENYLHVGGKIICVSNEWEHGNLMRAEIVGFGVHDIPMIRNMDTGEEYLCFGATLPYHEELFAGLQKLNPYERYSLLIANHAISADGYIFGKEKRDPDYV